MKPIEVKKNPSCAEMLRCMKVGEVKVFKLMGRTYNALLTARSRLRKEIGGDWLFETDPFTNELTITRTV